MVDIINPLKFSEFKDGDEVKVGDQVVGLRDSDVGFNYRFNFPGSGIQDANGAYLLRYFSAGIGAANYPQFTTSISTQPVNLSVDGVDADIDLRLRGKGVGIVDVPTPTQANSAATKAYVDATALAESKFEGCRVTNSGNYSSVYDNGTAGVGATLTATFNGAATVDGVILSVGDLVLFKDQTADFENGVYQLTTNGTAGTPSIFTRSTTFDSAIEIPAGQGIGVGQGTINADTVWLQTEIVTTIGASPILFREAGIRPIPSATDNAIVRWDGVAGDLVQNSLVILDDVGVLTGITQLNVDNIRIDGNTISSTDTNGNIDVVLDGTGLVTINSSAAGADTILDEDNMASDSETALATQQSIKGYVDANAVASAGATTDNALARFDGVTGLVIQNSVAILNDAGDLSGLTQLSVDNLRLDGNTISSTDTNGNVNVSPDGTGGFTVNFSTAKIDDILDEDNLVSDSDTALVTQQSIKAYVDARDIGIIPQYRVELSGDQSIPSGVATKIQFDTEIFDTNSNYDNVTNYRWTPTEPGKYLITAILLFENITASDVGICFIFKNGSTDSQNVVEAYANNVNVNPMVTALIDMNGTTDFIEIYAFQDSGANKNVLAGTATYVCGFKVASL